MTEAQKKVVDQRRNDLKYQLNWVIGNPHRIADPDLREGSIDFLKGSLAELDKPIEKAPPARRARLRLRDRLRTLYAAIVTQSMADGK